MLFSVPARALRTGFRDRPLFVCNSRNFLIKHHISTQNMSENVGNISWDEISMLAKRCTGFSSFKSSAVVVEDSGIKFVIRIADALNHKPAANPKPDDGAPKKFEDPFEKPHTKDLFLKRLSESHSLMMNKFNVVDNHLLIVTNEFENQQDPLNSNDLDAAWLLCRDLKGLAFFNCGPKSGASQPHKHLQFVPLPTHPEIGEFPIEQLFDGASNDVQMAPKLPFVHFAIFWPNAGPIDGTILESKYKLLLHRLNEFNRAVNPNETNPVDYNLIMTANFMLVAPRSREHAEGVFVNSLGFAASIFVKTEAQYQTLLRLTPLNVLATVGYPKVDHERLLASL